MADLTKHSDSSQSVATKPITVTREQLEVLEALSSTEEHCYNYDGLESSTNYKRPALQRYMKTLRELGLTEYWRGLMTEDGEVAGSGFCRSRLGNDFVYAYWDSQNLTGVSDLVTTNPDGTITFSNPPKEQL